MRIYKLYHESTGFKSIDINDSLANLIVNEYQENNELRQLDLGSLKWTDCAKDEIQCDFPFLSGNIPVISERAYTCLKTELDKCNLELLPLEVDSDRYFLIHFLESSDKIFNKEKSKISRFKSGTIKSVEKYVFNSEAISSPFFILSQFKVFVFGTENIRTLTEKNHLSGLSYEECEIR